MALVGIDFSELRCRRLCFDIGFTLYWWVLLLLQRRASEEFTTNTDTTPLRRAACRECLEGNGMHACASTWSEEDGIICAVVLTSKQVVGLVGTFRGSYYYY